jgi:hypothetical protein
MKKSINYSNICLGILKIRNMKIIALVILLVIVCLSIKKCQCHNSSFWPPTQPRRRSLCGVRLIYRLFLEGKTPHGIAKQLTADGVTTPGGKEQWQPGTILSILTNEKYKGDALLQKKYTVDFLTKKQKVNEGEVPQYYVENSHPAISIPRCSKCCSRNCGAEKHFQPDTVVPTFFQVVSSAENAERIMAQRCGTPTTSIAGSSTSVTTNSRAKRNARHLILMRKP